MKKVTVLLLLFSCIISHATGDIIPEFTGVWLYTDYSLAAENMFVYEIDRESFYITITISSIQDLYEESLELHIIEYNETHKHIKTEVKSRNGGNDIFDMEIGDIGYWTYTPGQGETMYFDVRKDTYPSTASTGPFESPEYFESGENWADFAGTWFWANEEGSQTETFIFSETHEESDMAVLEIHAEGEDCAGYALFEIPVYNQGNKNIRLMCLESTETLAQFNIGSIWYCTYRINGEEAFFELSKASYPESASSGPYHKMTGGM